MSILSPLITLVLRPPQRPVHIFRLAPRRAVLEFGAKQVVLVWSEEKKREMKEKLTQSLVMTIHECKGFMAGFGMSWQDLAQ